MTLYISNRDGDGKTSEEGHYRLQTQILKGNSLGSTSLQVTQNSPAGMSVIVAPGDFKIDTGDEYAYTGWNTDNVVLSVSTSDPANPRITSVVIYVDKDETTAPSPPNNPGIAKLAVVNGTPAPVPSAPNDSVIQTIIGAGNPYAVLANITIAAASSSITNASISDQRQLITITDNLVDTSSIKDGLITSSKIASGAVLTANIADGNITTDKIGNNQVTASKIEAQQAWITLSLVNSWQTFSTEYNNPQYMKDSLGFVHVRGLVKSGTAALIATLPEGYRPVRRNIWATASGQAFGRLDVLANGQIIAGGNGGPYNNSWLSLDCVSFMADA